jgi:trimeric autotransporter adhesin
MERKLLLGVSLILVLCLTAWTAAQQIVTTPAAASAAAVVPNVINYSGVLSDLNGKPLSGIQGVTFLLYNREQGGTPLWMETQNVTPGKNGFYTATLGATTSQGLPADLFASAEARWLAVQVVGQPEQPRVLLVAVPYALKAADAQTVGGLPASAFVLAAPPTTAATIATTGASAVGSSSTPPPVTSNVTTTGGTVNTIPMFTTATNIQNSIMTQIGTTSINVRGKLNLPATGAAIASKGFNSQPQDFVASVFSSGTATAVAQIFQWQAEPLNNDTTTATGTLNLLYASGTGVPAETGLKISSKGLFTFAAGQKFPGTSTITDVKAGTDLTGGGTTGIVTLNLDTTRVPQLAAANTFTANQKVNGTMTATSFSGNGAALTNVNAAKLGGLGAGAFAQLAANNTFTGSQQLFNKFVIVGPITSFTEGQLAAGASDAFQVAFGAAGFTVPSGSNENGTDGIVTFGGSGDVSSGFATGGVGISAEGGGGFNGAAGVSGLGGGGGPCCIGSVDGDGGFFEGGSNSLNAGDGVFGLTGSGFAGNFSGSINVSNQIFAAVKDFRIDHPLDPANKYLTHASVESSEMMNIYTGNVTTDTNGEATVSFPDWFEVLNTDFRYQLTVIGQFAQAIISRKIANHQFSIRTNVPNVEVSWQVTGVRQDRFAKAHPLVVEAEKESRVKGFYIHPELYGAPEEKQIEWARHPEMMKQSKVRRARQAAMLHKTVTPPAQDALQNLTSPTKPN